MRTAGFIFNFTLHRYDFSETVNKLGISFLPLQGLPTGLFTTISSIMRNSKQPGHSLYFDKALRKLTQPLFILLIILEANLTANAGGININFADSTAYHVLYLSNDSGTQNQFVRLLSKMGKRPKKLVFQFYHQLDSTTKQAQLTLAVWRGTKHRNKRFDVNNLTILNVDPNKVRNLPNDGVFIGDLELSKKDIKTLKQYINSSAARYIVFTPYLLTEGGRRHVSYQLSYEDSLEKGIDPVISATLNPSPPRKSY